MNGGWLSLANSFYLALALLSFVLSFLAFVIILTTILGPVGAIFGALVLTAGSMLAFINSIHDTMDLYDSGKISAEDANSYIAAKAIATIANNSLSYYLGKILDAPISYVVTFYRIAMFGLVQSLAEAF